ncbi:MAG TPA: TetR/AcrR family transcriptional regulator [Bradyrhizobium sp.]|uniref:TetR/AcrR family transcriptional regulator n=1 Tax=Bradyrhizobium sp. TaxID=376 RepID=UPI002B536968|nr:TetR/AcrR family transcriptional regulator [Bradyrhizobium sp.]HLZ03765.1 TetR/AcrR family transcriptional regulator [Bradyrhizobium sp.]
MAKAARRRVGNAKQKPARERILAVAADLFYRKGIRAVGVEEIVNDAGVAKISLYRSFKSKDDLIVAYLEQRNVEFWQQWDAHFSPFADDPRTMLNAITDFFARRTTQAGYRGCPFINYANEFADPSHPGHRVVEANRREWRRRLTAIAEALGVPKPKLLADGLLLLVEGAYTISQTLGGPKGPGAALTAVANAMVVGHMQN